MMCRVYLCFENEWDEDAEDNAIRALRKLHHTGNVNRLTVYADIVRKYDPRMLEDFTAVHRTITGACKRHWQHIFPTERDMVKTLRQWARKTAPDYVSSNIAERAAMNNDMLIPAPISERQKIAIAKAQRITPRYVISPRGREYLAWLEARENEQHAAEDALYREHVAGQRDRRALMAGVG